MIFISVSTTPVSPPGLEGKAPGGKGTAITLPPALGWPFCGCDGDRGSMREPCPGSWEKPGGRDRCSQSSVSGTLLTDAALLLDSFL